MILMYVGATDPAPPVPSGISDPLLHLLALSVYDWRGMGLEMAQPSGAPGKAPPGQGVVAYGAGLEVRQAFVAARTAELADAYANAVGAGAGTFACWAWGIIASRPAPRETS